MCSAQNYIASVGQLAVLAGALDREADAERLTKLAQALRAEYAAAFTNHTTGCWGGCGQSAIALALVSGVVPEAKQSFAREQLLASLKTTAEHVTVGIIGAKALFPAFDLLGDTEQAARLAETTSYPSWGYMIFNEVEPAPSSLWELWDAPTQGPGMNSRNHHMFSSISAWLVRSIGGFRDFTCGGDARPPLRLAPAAALGVAWANTSTTLPCGRARLAYRRHGGVQCTTVPEGRSSAHPGAPVVADAVLDCGAAGGVIQAVEFASFGRPSGHCGGALTANASCHHPDSLGRVAERCVGRQSCRLPSHAGFWGTAGCDPALLRHLQARVRCSRPASLAVEVALPVGARAVLALPWVAPAAAGAGEPRPRLREGGLPVAVGGASPAADTGVVSARLLPAGSGGPGYADGVVEVEVGSGEYAFHLQ